MGRSAALERLLKHAYNVRDLGGRRMALIVKLLGNAECYELRYGDLMAAIAAISRDIAA